MMKYKKIINTLNNKEAYISQKYFVEKGMKASWNFIDKQWIDYYELDKELEVL